MRKVTILLVLALVALAGCGSDDDPTIESGGTDTTAASGAGDTSGRGADPYGDAYGGAKPDGGSSAEGDTVKAVDYDFEPTELKVSSGTKVTFENTGDDVHTFTATDGAFDSGNVESGESFEHTFAEAGTFDFRCNIHPNMQGKVTVS